MDSLFSLIDVFNAASLGGVIEVDAGSILVLKDALGILAAALLASLAFCSYFCVSAVRSRGLGQALSPEPMEVIAEKLRRQLGEMVRKTNDRNNYINSIFSSIEDGFMLVDGLNRVVLYNPRAMELLGLGPEVFFTSVASSSEDKPLAPVLAACARVTAARIPERISFSAGGGITIDARINPVVDKYGAGTSFGSIAVVRDVTEIRRLENLKKDFVANVSHEFRTPLTLISGFIEMLRMRSAISAEDRERAYEIMDIETERLKRLVSELLTLSEIENQLPHEADNSIDVNAVVSGLVTTMESLAEKKRQALTLTTCQGAAVLRGNENWFYLAVKNLIDNAIKYTPEGGAVRVETSVENGFVLICVSDTGIGIAADEHERIFERFYRVEKSRGSGKGGSGLGLALVKDIAAIFNGGIEVRSAIGEGALFILRLPILKEGSGADEEA